MRTRFLLADYFNSATESLEFLHCPPPHLPASYSSIHEHLQRCFHDVSALGISLEIDQLPIQTSLNKFLSDVLPQFIDAEIGDFADDLSCSGTACCPKPRSFCADLTLEIDASQEKNNIFSEEEEEMYNQEKDESIKGTNDIEILQFEIPEKYDLHPQKESMKIFSEIPRVETEVDVSSLILRMQDILEIRQAVYSVDSVLTEYCREQKADFLEDSGSTGGQSVSEFPVFEIHEASLGIFNDISMKDELISFENIEFQKWIQEDERTRNNKEHLGFKEFDFIAYLSNHCSAMQHPGVEMTCSNFCREIEFISSNEDSDIWKMLLLHQGTYTDIYICSRSIILFEEFQFIGLQLYNFNEVFYDLAIMQTIEACDSMFSEAMKFKNFNDLIASNELILMDDSFRSLPVPILSDSQNTWSFHSLVENIYSVLEPESSSTFDGLYLDWHVFEEDNCNRNRYSSCWKAFEEADAYSIDSALTIIDKGMLVLDFVLSGGSLNKPNLPEKKEILKINLHESSVPPISHKEVACQKLLNDDDRNGGTGEIQSEIGAAKVYVAVETAGFNEIDFLLNPHECSGGIKKDKPFEWSISKDTVLPTIHSGDSLAACATTQVPLPQWNIEILQVELSDEILILIDNFQKSFLGILRSDAELMKDLYPCQDLDDISCLRVRKDELLDHIQKTSAPGTLSALTDQNIMSLVALCAIKQMAWYLCYYGLHATQLYIHNLSTSVQCLKSRLSFLQNLIDNMCRKAEKEITKFHPSLSVVQQLLRSSFSEIDLNVLIVAEPVFWWPLKRLLTSMKISYIEPQNFWSTTFQQDELNDFGDPTSIMFQSRCCLVSHDQGTETCLTLATIFKAVDNIFYGPSRYFSASLRYEKFGIILEYGGSHESSRVCNISSKLDHDPRLFFLKVKLEESGVPKAICDGVDMTKTIENTMKGDPPVIPLLKESKNKMKELLNFMPVENYKAPVEAVDTDQERYLKPSHSVAMESKEIHRIRLSSPDTVIVVNTKNFDKEMVISRRSTYQKILALEKGEAQVVERDLNLPVDVIVDAATCLAWYDLKNIGKKSSAPDEAFSCLPQCVENIAASMLTSISYAFSSCILVFEGEKHFLAGVTESSDELYAAAASLGIDMQIFCSYSPVMTEEIILSCIEAVTKLTRCPYRKMSDSESLAESFLTAFPSINPLSAHGILSSGGTLIEFLEWSHDRRVHAVKKHKIPDESVALLGLLCQYGEREDSKSGMTDTSSSVSYVPGRFQPGSNSETRKRKWTDNLLSVDTYKNDLSHFEPLTLFSEVRLSPSRTSTPLNIWMSENSEIIDECGKSGLSFDYKAMNQRKDLDPNMMRNFSEVFPLCGFGMAEDFPTSEERQQLKNFRHNGNFGAKERLHVAARSKSCSRERGKSGNQQENLMGEVIDTDVNATFRKEIYSLGFSPCEVNKDGEAGTSRTVRKLSFGSSSLPSFPTSNEIDSDLDVWICQSNHDKSSRKGNKSAPDDCSNNGKFGAKERLHVAARSKSCSRERGKSGNQQENLIGEVIGTDVNATFRKEIAELNSLGFSPCEVNKDGEAGTSRTVRKLSFGSSSLPSFPMSNEIDSDLDVWICQSNHDKSSRKGNKSTPDDCSNNHKFSPKHQKGLFHANMVQKTAINSYDRQMQENAHCDRTPLWDAIHSSQPMRESPWTMEFLNRIKEKSRTCQQSLPCGIAAPCFGSARNKSNGSKRKSPSILDYYKYQRIGDPKKSIDQRRQKQSVKPSCSSKNEKTSDPILPTWTPVDKRAKHTLSFSTIGSGGQSKLIWSDKNSPTLSRKILHPL